MSALVSSRSSLSWSGPERMGFVQDEDDASVAFVFLGREQFTGLGNQGGFVEPGASSAVTMHV